MHPISLAIILSFLTISSKGLYGACSDHTSTIAKHVQAGRAEIYSCGQYCEAYRSKGSHDKLGIDDRAVVTLYGDGDLWDLTFQPGSHSFTRPFVHNTHIDEDFDPCTEAESRTFDVVVNLHGWLGSPDSQDEHLPFADQVNFRDIVVITPEVPGTAWNSQATSDVDKYGFDLALHRLGSIGQLFLAGHSAGGRQVYKYGRKGDKQLSAMIAFAGDDDQVSPNLPPRYRLRNFAIGGTEDTVVPYEGQLSMAEAVAEGFSNSCRRNDTSTVGTNWETNEGNSIEVIIYNGCSLGGESYFYKSIGGDHSSFMPQELIIDIIDKSGMGS